VIVIHCEGRRGIDNINGVNRRKQTKRTRIHSAAMDINPSEAYFAGHYGFVSVRRASLLPHERGLSRSLDGGERRGIRPMTSSDTVYRDISMDDRRGRHEALVGSWHRARSIGPRWVIGPAHAILHAKFDPSPHKQIKVYKVPHDHNRVGKREWT
jgi:hypothetical protein